MDNYHAEVAIFNGDGKIVLSQPYDDFTFGRKDLNILRVMYGRKLFDLLYDELNVIRYGDNQEIILAVLFQNDINRTAMQLLGKIAEAIIVRRCLENAQINQSFFSIARRKNAKAHTARKFRAIGTGLKHTQENYPQQYNPSDTQRDIIWYNDETCEVATMKNSPSNSTTSAILAGLQIKASKNGLQYVLPDLLSYRYAVPIVYFDISNDYNKIVNKIYKDTKIDIEFDFIHIKAIDEEAFDEFLNYVDLIYAMLDNRIKPMDLIRYGTSEETYALRNALTSIMLSNVGFVNSIQH